MLLTPDLLIPGYGDEEIRTLDPLLARQVLSQLSYAPVWYTLYILSISPIEWA